MADELKKVALTKSLDDFGFTNVDFFNECLCHGNPLIAEGTVYYYDTFSHTVTVSRCDGQWVCEVTHDLVGETGLYEGWGDTPDEAWEMTRRKIVG